MRFSLLALVVTVLWLYPATADAMDCPAGYQQLASAGTDFGCDGFGEAGPRLYQVSGPQAAHACARNLRGRRR